MIANYFLKIKYFRKNVKKGLLQVIFVHLYLNCLLKVICVHLYVNGKMVCCN